MNKTKYITPEQWKQQYNERMNREAGEGTGNRFQMNREAGARAAFGMDYGSPGQLGGLGGGYVQPNMMYFGSEKFIDRLYMEMKNDSKFAARLNKAAKGSKAEFRKQFN